LSASEQPQPDHSRYDDHYHDLKAAESRRAADAVLPLVLAVVDVKCVLDVGCGYGDWLAAARAFGITDLAGVEGPWAEAWRERGVLATQFELMLLDLERPLRLGRRYDLVVCIEVAEHLTAARGPGFVADLCAAAGAVLLGAAIPGQKGPNHVNERWPSEWAADFARHGYQPLDCIRPRVWGDSALLVHHRQNPVLFVHEHGLAEARARAVNLPQPNPAALDLVHPQLYLRAATRDDSVLTLRQHLAQIPGAFVRSVTHHATARWRSRYSAS
jgi:SAM-dependent methyltransferase